MTYRTSCSAIGHFDFLLSLCYLKDTIPSQWSSSDFLLWALRIWESFFYSQAFFTLPSFLLVLRSPWGRQFNLNISRASCWYFRNIAPVRLFAWITTSHIRNMLVSYISGLRQAMRHGECFLQDLHSFHDSIPKA